MAPGEQQFLQQLLLRRGGSPLAALALLLFPCAIVAQDPLARLSWLSGCWQSEGREPGSGEHWLPPDGGTMFGVSRTLRDGRTVAHEFMQIRPDPEGRLEFVALPSGQAETTFRQAGDVGAEGILFENPEHDFPQRVIYRTAPGGRLLARIEGTRNGVSRGIDFPMRQIPCDPASPGHPAAASVNEADAMKPRISMITLGVRDLARSIEFYQRGLGLPRMESPPEVAFFTLNGTWLGLFGREALAEDAGVPAAGSGFSGVTLAHNVDSEAAVDALMESAVAAGATLVKAPQKVFWGGYSGYFADPDGHLWEIAHNPLFWVGPRDE